MKERLLQINKKLLNHCISRSLFTNLFNKSDEVTKLIKSADYKGELHNVTTDDGYILSVHRVRPNKKVEFKGTAFLMHGLFRNSADFLATGPKIALPYVLSDCGFDVYLGNARGSKFSTQHATRDNKSREYWNFSFHEIGLYDLPTMMQFVIDKTGCTNTNYIGHSQGCTSVLALLSSRPEYNSMLSQVHLMAPAVYVHYSTSPAFKIGRSTSKLLKRMSKIDIRMFLSLANKLSKFNEGNPDILMDLYEKITCNIVGKNKIETQLSLEAIKSFNHFMSPIVSAKQLNHYLQLYKSEKFQHYDHEKHNYHYYESLQPPEYDLNNVTVPTYLYHAEEDTLVTTRCVERLARELPNVQNYEIIKDYNHLDVMLGKNSRRDVYTKIVDFMIK